MPASPYFAFLFLRTLINDNKILAPLIPIGWPKAIAPPWIFTFSMSKFSSFCKANIVVAKASLNSK